MASREFAAVFARLAADRTGLAKDLNAAVKDSQRAGSEIEKGFQRPFTKGFVGGLRDADSSLAALGTRAGSLVGVLTNPWALGAAAVGGLVAALGFAITKGLEFDREFTKIAVLLDKDVDVEGLRQRFLTLDPALGSSTDAMRVFRGALQDTGNTEAAFQITQVALALGKVTGTDPALIAEQIGGLADAFGVGADKAQEFADVLFTVAKHGGGSITGLSENIGGLADAIATLGVSGTQGIKEIGAALIALGEISGRSGKETQQALQRTLIGIGANVGRFRELGVDLDGLIDKNGLVIGSLLALKQATGGTRAKLIEMGVPAKSLTTILKAMSEDGIERIRAGFETLEREAPGSVLQGLATRNKAVSSELERLGLSVEKLGEKTGDTLLGFFRDKGPLPLTKRVEELKAEIVDLDRRIGIVTKVDGPAAAAFLEGQKKKAQEALGGAQALLGALEQTGKAGEASTERRARLDEGLSFAQEKQAAELLALERKVSAEREDLAAGRAASLVKLLADERAAEADSELERIAIRRQEAIDAGKIDDDRTLDKRRALERELEAVRSSTSLGASERRKQELELTRDLDKLDSDLVGSRQARAFQLRAFEQQELKARQAEEDRAFALRRALGEASLRDEIDRLRRISTEEKRTRDERLTALQQAFEKEKQLREQSRSAALGLIGEVQDSFKAQGITAVTQDQFKAELDRLQQVKQATVAGTQTAFNVGGAVDLEQLKQAVTFAGQLEQTQSQLRELGGVGNIFGQAFSVDGEAGRGILEFRQIFTDFSATVLVQSQTMKTGYADAMLELAQVVDRSMTSIEQRVARANGVITTGIKQAVKTDIAREIDRDEKRY